MISALMFSEQTQSERYTGIPYSKLDCQAFVEEVLKDCGVRKPDGTTYNWKGSNSMWRNALSWKGTIEECRTKYGDIPEGAWVFTVKYDGGEIDRGYHDNEGNAKHVGIYVGRDTVRDSTKTAQRNGVGYRSLDGFTHVGLAKMIDYNNQNDVLISIDTIRNSDASASQILTALEILTNYLKGV